MTEDIRLRRAIHPEEQDKAQPAEPSHSPAEEQGYHPLLTKRQPPMTGHIHTLQHHPHIPDHMESHEKISAEIMHQEAQSGKSNELILRTLVNWIMYIILVFAIFLFITGHNAPGGGFIAGLMTASVVVMLYVSFGSVFLEERLRFDFKYLMAVGLTLALGCGLGGVMFGDPFLTHTFGNVHLGPLGEVELATATIFDLGVYLVVTGGCVTIITAIGQSMGKRPAPGVNDPSTWEELEPLIEKDGTPIPPKQRRAK